MPGAEAARPAGPSGPPPSEAAGPGPRLRLRYAKLGRLRFTSHRDVVRMWERGLRRSGLPVGWSEGFSPRPLVSFGLALPTGAESVAEYLDVALRPGSEDLLAPELAADLAARLSGCLPEGLDVGALGALAPGSGSLQHEVSSCSWKLEVLGLGAVELGSRVERLLAAPSVPIERERKGRAVRDDLRPAVRSLAVTGPPGTTGGTAAGDRSGTWLDAELATHPRGVRPRELLEGLGPDVRLSRARRMHQWIERDGARWEPLGDRGSVAGAVRAHAGGLAP